MYNPARVKEEAEELINSFAKLPEEGSLMWHVSFEIAKKCALITVDKLIYYSQAHGLPVLTKFYEEVKQEIINYGKVTI